MAPSRQARPIHRISDEYRLVEQLVDLEGRPARPARVGFQGLLHAVDQTASVEAAIARS